MVCLGCRACAEPFIANIFIKNEILEKYKKSPLLGIGALSYFFVGNRSIRIDSRSEYFSCPGGFIVTDNSCLVSLGKHHHVHSLFILMLCLLKLPDQHPSEEAKHGRSNSHAWSHRKAPIVRRLSKTSRADKHIKNPIPFRTELANSE